MTTQRPISAGTASAGVHHVAKITSMCNSVFNEIGQQNDLGNDAFIEFVVDGASTGCCIAAQIKSGASYIRSGAFVIPADEKHFDYWRSLNMPICGIVYDPISDVARWVDITAQVGTGFKPDSFTIRVPSENVFDAQHFATFREHFLEYRTRFSDSAHFGSALAGFSRLEDFGQCRNSMRALFSFHRNRIETWFYVISCIANFRGHPLLRDLVVMLSHVPGHMDIFWSPQNIISEAVTREVEVILRRMLLRDSVLTIVSVIDGGGGIGRGTIGQCVRSIVALAPDRRQSLESIAFDPNVEQKSRYWALILLVAYEQRRHFDYTIGILEKALGVFSDDEDQECLHGLYEGLKKDGFIDFS
jgi:hypothetical protein